MIEHRCRWVVSAVARSRPTAADDVEPKFGSRGEARLIVVLACDAVCGFLCRYPTVVGRNWKEVCRSIDALKLTKKFKVGRRVGESGRHACALSLSGTPTAIRPRLMPTRFVFRRPRMDEYSPPAASTMNPPAL